MLFHLDFHHLNVLMHFYSLYKHFVLPCLSLSDLCIGEHADMWSDLCLILFVLLVGLQEFIMLITFAVKIEVTLSSSALFEPIVEYLT